MNSKLHTKMYNYEYFNDCVILFAHMKQNKYEKSEVI